MSTTSTPVYDTYVGVGLEGQDDNIEILQGYFREMQMMTVETSMNTDIDFLTFAMTAQYFGVIMMKEFEEYPGYCPMQVEVEDELPRDLDDEELAELNIPRPITKEEFLALPEAQQTERWTEAWEAKKKGSLYDDSEFAKMEDSFEDRRGKKVLRPGDIDFYMSDEDEDVPSLGKGKRREVGLYAVDFPIPNSVNDHLINWPEDSDIDGGPPSSDDDFYSVSTDTMSESPAPFDDLFEFSSDPPPVDPNFGREYLESDTEPPLQMLPIPEDPIAERVVRAAASRKMDELRAETVHLYEKKKARLARRRILEARNKGSGVAAMSKLKKAVPRWQGAPKMDVGRPIGLVYLTSSQNVTDPLHKGEYSIGFYVTPQHRHWDSNVRAVLNKTIEDAFRDPDCHRLQAVLVDHPDILDFLDIFTSAGFRREGIRRRAFFSHIAGEWKDVTYLAILATEWIHDHSSMAKLLPSSLWDELLSRHQREQEEFIRMEKRKSGSWSGGLKRSSSVETIREVVPVTALSVESGVDSSGFTTDASSESFVLAGKRRKIGLNLSSDIRVAERSSSFSSSESEWDMTSGVDVDMFSDAPGPSSADRIAK